MAFRAASAVFCETVIICRAAPKKITLTLTKASAVHIVTSLRAGWVTHNSLGLGRAKKDEKTNRQQQAEREELSRKSSYI